MPSEDARGRTPNSTRGPTSSRAASPVASRVSTLTGNSGEHVALMFACAKAGAILHPISWRLAPAKIAFQLDDAESAVFLVEDEHCAAGRGCVRARVRDAAPAARARLAPRAGHACRRRRSAAPDLHVRHDRQAERRAAHPRELLLDEPLVRPRDRVGPHDVVLQVLPQFHVGGWNVQSILAWWKGARVVLERGFDAARALELIERERVTTLMGVPANYLFMSQEPRFADGRSVARSGSPSSAGRRCRWRCSTSGPTAASRSSRATA